MNCELLSADASKIHAKFVILSSEVDMALIDRFLFIFTCAKRLFSPIIGNYIYRLIN